MCKELNIDIRETLIGPLGIAELAGKIVRLYLPNELKTINCKPTPILSQAFAELEEYFAGERRRFSLDFAIEGSEFAQTVWRALIKIPYGETKTYKEIALAIDDPKSFRAVGSVCGKNPIPIIIPCHRVIGSSGSLTGYRGGVALKKIPLGSRTEVLAAVVIRTSE